MRRWGTASVRVGRKVGSRKSEGVGSGKWCWVNGVKERKGYGLKGVEEGHSSIKVRV